jgi:magnesium and cobalt transporter
MGITDRQMKLWASEDGVHRGWLGRLSHVLSGKPQSHEQLVTLLRDAHRRELLGADALAMIEGVFHVSEMRVRDVMIPRAQMKVVREDDDLQAMLPLIIESAHSRFPVIGDNRDEVVGILLAKDLLRYFVVHNREVFDLQDILRPAVFIPESKRLNVLLKEFRHGRNHMAIVVDEYGGVAGLITIEDVLEQIVGEISDEHDVEESGYISRLAENRYALKALTPIESFNEHFHTDFSDQEFGTIGGMLLSRFGHLPRRGERLDMGRFHFEVVRADHRRIHLLQLEIRAGAGPNGE